ncbi:MAG TPA: ABC-F family ATP-binding cassette domain-containing protein [Actinomycetota bacterium]|jgi:ATPase subunit of ABC transporter with duplicated ATPase domains|nr:ABC-F family ATP-binding cassette domain-containing protein [Actinomycetota bacterium]
MSALQTWNLAIEVAGRPLLEGLTLSLREGDKVGVVGRNGAGKTSLLDVLAGEESPLTGRVVVRGRIGYLRQDPRQHRADEDRPGLEHLLRARGLPELAEKMEKARLAVEERPSDGRIQRFARLEERYRIAGGYGGEAEARRISAGLGLAPDRLDLSVPALSGGERRRLELARILFAAPDVILLDEPTNHLDTDAKHWLMRFLGSYRGVLVVVSHDLALLDASITRTLHLDREGVVPYRGTYSEYRAARRQDEIRLRALAERQRAEIRRLKTLADSMRGQTEKRARKAKTLDTRVARLESAAVRAPTRERAVRYRLPAPPHAGKVVLEAAGLAKGYGGPPVFEDVGFAVGRGDRLLVMGLNGAGKTSLLRILAGASEADAGSVRLGHGISLGYYAQEHELLRDEDTALAHVRTESTDASDQDLRSLLGMFGLTGDVAFQPAGTLSGGEKTKLSLAQLVAGRCNLILLDEPTNNLDPPSRTAVADALATWPGTMILVSHDVAFVQALEPQRVLTMPEGELGFWDEELLELVELA